jgi:hypothetical protein
MCTSNNTPQFDVHLDLENAFLAFSGEALPDMVEERLDICKVLLRDFTMHKQGAFRIEFSMVYFNTKISRYFLEILTILNNYAAMDNVVSVSWNSEIEDTDMLQMGIDYEDELKHLTFEYGTFVFGKQ